MTRRYAKRYSPGSAVTRAHAVIDYMMQEIERGLKHPEELTSEEWKVLFGTKDSLVVNLQKLITAMSCLEDCGTRLTTKAVTPERTQPLSADEMTLLSDWLKQEQAASANATTAESAETN